MKTKITPTAEVQHVYLAGATAAFKRVQDLAEEINAAGTDVGWLLIYLDAEQKRVTATIARILKKTAAAGIKQ